MNKLFYPKLAATNIKKNYQTYIPYILTSIGTIIMYYIMKSITLEKGLDGIRGSAQIKTVLAMGSFIIALFSLIFLYYTNSFLIKKRKKEFGLFIVLGMEKRHISKIMFFETIYVAFISIILGLSGGMVLSKLMYMLLLKLLRFEVPMGYSISFQSIYYTLGLFGFIFLLTFITNLRQIHLANPIELLQGGQVGEKEPKTKWLLTLVGLVSLVSGYTIALTTESPIAALYKFFIAVILVIIGTYCLFTSGSITFLKILRRNKNYYYKTKHFTTVSGMMYRMKQNAVGLANICILSTAVLVMLSSTVTLYLGTEDSLRTRFQRNIIISSSDISKDYRNGIKDTTYKVLNRHNIKGENISDYRSIYLSAIRKGDSFNIKDKNEYTTDTNFLFFIPLEDYNAIHNTASTLEDNEIFMIASEEYTHDTLTIFDNTFHIKEDSNSLCDSFIDMGGTFSSFFIVVNDMSHIEELYTSCYGDFKESFISYEHIYGFDVNTDYDETLKIAKELRSSLKEDYSSSTVQSVAESKETFYSLHGGLFFLGIFLGALFIMATVLIIYYKQISEGFDDKARFEIMKKVGMSREEIKKSIRSQVLTVFFLPIVTAAIHIGFAFKIITKLFVVVNITNVTLFIWCTVGTILVFGLFYGIIYGLTAKVYYKIIS